MGQESFVQDWDETEVFYSWEWAGENPVLCVEKCLSLVKEAFQTQRQVFAPKTGFVSHLVHIC